MVCVLGVVGRTEERPGSCWGEQMLLGRDSLEGTAALITFSSLTYTVVSKS